MKQRNIYLQFVSLEKRNGSVLKRKEKNNMSFIPKKRPMPVVDIRHQRREMPESVTRKLNLAIEEVNRLPSEKHFTLYKRTPNNH